MDNLSDKECDTTSFLDIRGHRIFVLRGIWPSNEFFLGAVEPTLVVARVGRKVHGEEGGCVSSTRR